MLPQVTERLMCEGLDRQSRSATGRVSVQDVQAGRGRILGDSVRSTRMFREFRGRRSPPETQPGRSDRPVTARIRPMLSGELDETGDRDQDYIARHLLQPATELAGKT